MSGRFPALGFDPVPGDADAVARTASRLRQVADELGRQAGVLARSAALASTWQGSAACVYAGRVAERVVELRTAAEVLGDLSQRLQRYARDLAWLQDRALRLERAAVPASTMVCLPGPATELEALRARARDLQEQAEHAARYVTAEVRRATEASPAARRFDGWSDNPFGIPVARWVAEHEDDLGVVADGAGVIAGAIAVAALTPLVAATAPVVTVGGGMLGGVVLVTHSATAVYGDGSAKDVALDVASLTALGVGVRAGRRGGATVVKASQRGGDALTAYSTQDIGRRRLGDEGSSVAPAARPAPALRQPQTPETRRIDASLRAAQRHELGRLLVRG